MSQTAGFEEVLWNFAHFEDERRVTLQHNPHFYSELPTSLDAYTSQFKASPVDKFQLKPNVTIYVLVDQRRRVYLETRRETRIFGSVFTLKDAMIFKGSLNVLSIPRGAFNISLDIHGTLEGESVVAESIRGIPNLWHSEKFFVVLDPSTCAYDPSLLPIVTANATAKRTSQDRIDLIRSALGPGDKDLHIYAGQLPPLWTTRKIVRYNKSGLRMLHVDHASIRYRPHLPRRQHLSDQNTFHYIHLWMCSTAIYCLLYSTTIGWTAKKAGISNSGGANSPASVQNGAMSYIDRPAVWICISLSRVTPVHLIYQRIYHPYRLSSTTKVRMLLGLTPIYFPQSSNMITYGMSPSRLPRRPWTS